MARNQGLVPWQRTVLNGSRDEIPHVLRDGARWAREGAHPLPGASRSAGREFHARGTLLMAGPMADPTAGAIGIFTSREAAEEFIRDDPFVVNGVVAKWTIREWNEVLAYQRSVGVDLHREECRL